MALHFTRDEFAARRKRACEQMTAAGLDGLLIFRQESMYWLTGDDTSGYSVFQGMYLGADGALALLTRSADQRQARLTSVIDDIRIWTDREGADPAGELRDMVADYGGREDAEPDPPAGAVGRCDRLPAKPARPPTTGYKTLN
jgi:Xaa-Pro dipeptidase